MPIARHGSVSAPPLPTPRAHHALTPPCHILNPQLTHRPPPLSWTPHRAPLGRRRRMPLLSPLAGEELSPNPNPNLLSLHEYALHAVARSPPHSPVPPRLTWSPPRNPPPEQRWVVALGGSCRTVAHLRAATGLLRTVCFFFRCPVSISSPF